MHCSQVLCRGCASPPTGAARARSTASCDCFFGCVANDLETADDSGMICGGKRRGRTSWTKMRQTRPWRGPSATCMTRRRIVQAGALLGAAALGVPCARGSAAAMSAISGALPRSAEDGVLVWNVAGLGYRAAEYIMSGSADVYQPVSMADAMDVASRDATKDLGARDFVREVLAANQPYKTALDRVPSRRSAALQRHGNRRDPASQRRRQPVWCGGRCMNSSPGAVTAYVGVQHPVTFAGLKAGRSRTLRRARRVESDPAVGHVAAGGSGAAVRGRRTAARHDGQANPHDRLLLYGRRHRDLRQLIITPPPYSPGALFSTAICRWRTRNTSDRSTCPSCASTRKAIFNGFGGLANRRPDDPLYRHYEVAGGLARHGTSAGRRRNAARRRKNPDAPGSTALR